MAETVWLERLDYARRLAAEGLTPNEIADELGAPRERVMKNARLYGYMDVLAACRIIGKPNQGTREPSVPFVPDYTRSAYNVARRHKNRRRVV